jgi:hypothetical protein
LISSLLGADNLNPPSGNNATHSIDSARDITNRRIDVQRFANTTPVIEIELAPNGWSIRPLKLEGNPIFGISVKGHIISISVWTN